MNILKDGGELSKYLGEVTVLTADDCDDVGKVRLTMFKKMLDKKEIRFINKNDSLHHEGYFILNKKLAGRGEA